MKRVLTFLAVAALAAGGWYIASQAGPGGDAPPADEGLVVHVRITDRAGEPVHPAQVVRVFDEARAHVGSDGSVRLTNVILRADEVPSVDAFAVALKPLARHHALRRGYAPEVTQRDDGAWDVHYRLHAHGILRVHVEPVNLGKCKAFLERDEPLQRWEPVGAHAVVRPGSVVDFRIFEGWGAPPTNGKLAVRLEGEPGPDGVPTVAAQRLFVDAPSPGHTAQLKLVPEPVDPIAGSVRIKEGPNPPTLRGHVIVRRIAKDDARVHLGTVPIDDEGSFVIRDAGPGRYELIAGLDFAPGLITTEADGGGYLELVTPGRARWVELAGVGEGTIHAVLMPPEGASVSAPESIRDLVARAWFARHTHAWSEDDAAAGGLPGGWSQPPVHFGEDGMALALPGAGAWRLHLSREATATQTAATATPAEVVLAPASSRAQAAVAWREVPGSTLVVRVDPEGWRDARSVVIEVAGRRRTVVRGGPMEVSFANVPSADGDVWVEATWDDPSLAQVSFDARMTGKEPVLVRPLHGGQLTVRVTGPGAGHLTAGIDLELVSTDGSARTEPVTLTRRGSLPIWQSEHAVAPGAYTWSVGLVTVFEGDGIAPWTSQLTMLPEGTNTGTPMEAVIRAGETTTLEFELPAK